MGFGSRPVSMVDHFEPLCVILAVVTCPSAIAAVRTWSARIASEVTEPVASFAAISHILLNTSVMYNSPTTLHSKGFLDIITIEFRIFSHNSRQWGGGIQRDGADHGVVSKCCAVNAAWSELRIRDAVVREFSSRNSSVCYHTGSSSRWDLVQDRLAW